MDKSYPVPSIKIPPSLLAIICKVLDNTETGSGDTNHLSFHSELLAMLNRWWRVSVVSTYCDDNPVGDESLEGDAHFVRGGAG